jgi:hypothetical protein
MWTVGCTPCGEEGSVVWTQEKCVVTATLSTHVPGDLEPQLLARKRPTKVSKPVFPAASLLLTGSQK